LAVLTVLSIVILSAVSIGVVLLNRDSAEHAVARTAFATREHLRD
ncbi:MAG: hypothetical protein JNM64_03225, partial [Chloroflexia bacterium]|nr:hypothetical protein [Chloroflexia bacterium]